MDSTISISTYIARMDDLSRVMVRLFDGVCFVELPYRERRRLHRITRRLLAGVSRSELLIESINGSE